MVKVLLCGDVGGEWKQVFDRVAKLHHSTHGPFDVLLCIGNSLPLPASDLQIPLPTYFLIGQEETMESLENYPEGHELRENLYFLGQQGVQNICGLEVAFLSGVFEESQYMKTDMSKTSNYYNHAMVQSLLHTIETKPSIDFLLTNEYPANYQRHVPLGNIPNLLHDVNGVDIIQHLAEKASPRYHVAATHGLFFQRLPYQNTKHQITRFIGLGKVPKANTPTDKSKKWLHALNVTPATNTGNDIPKGTTPNPYEKEEMVPSSKRQKRSNLSEEQIHALTNQSDKESKQFFYDSSRSFSQPDASHFRKRRRDRREECWFCLSTPTVETHLITSIGMEMYLALPKGGMVPDHILIIPIKHETSMFEISAEAAQELEQYKIALREFYSQQDKTYVLFERQILTKGTIHAHLQVIPIPLSKRAMIRDVFETEGPKYNMHFQEYASYHEVQEQALGHQYFYVEYLNETNTLIRLLHLIDGRYFLQFGRHCLGILLNLSERVDWKFCVLPQDKEEEWAQTFKQQFKPFDFTLE